jgi:hypothetical protein
MCPTLLGRLQTRIAVLVLPALIGLVLSLVLDEWDWLALIGIYLVMGAVLDIAIYNPIASWQPPWLTGVLGLAEFVLLLVLALVLGLDIPVWQAAIYYVAVWLIAQAVRIAVLPLIFLTRLEDGGELRPVRWAVNRRHEQLPVLAIPEALPERLSGVWGRPSRVGAKLPPPSQVGPVPPDFLAPDRQRQAARS